MPGLNLLECFDRPLYLPHGVVVVPISGFQLGAKAVQVLKVSGHTSLLERDVKQAARIQNPNQP